MTLLADIEVILILKLNNLIFYKKLFRNRVLSAAFCGLKYNNVLPAWLDDSQLLSKIYLKLQALSFCFSIFGS